MTRRHQTTQWPLGKHTEIPLQRPNSCFLLVLQDGTLFLASYAEASTPVWVWNAAELTRHSPNTQITQVLQPSSVLLTPILSTPQQNKLLLRHTDI